MRASRLAVAALAVVVATVLLTHVGSAPFAASSGDDSCYAARALTLGFLPAETAWYWNWSGRYTGTFLLSAFGPTDMEWTHSLLGVGALLSTFLAMLALVVAVSTRTPRTLLATEITTDAGNFKKGCLAGYHGVRSVRLGSSEPSLRRSTWMSGKERR